MGKCAWCDRFAFRLQDALCHACWLDSIDPMNERDPGPSEEYDEYDDEYDADQEGY